MLKLKQWTRSKEKKVLKLQDAFLQRHVSEFMCNYYLQTTL